MRQLLVVVAVWSGWVGSITGTTAFTPAAVSSNRQQPWSSSTQFQLRLRPLYWMQPRPPSTPPPPELMDATSEQLYHESAQLRREEQLTAEAVVELEGRVAQLQDELSEKQAQLAQQETQHVQEKTGLLHKIQEFATQLAARDNELDTNAAVAASDEVDRLQREVELLQQQLPAVQNLLRTEKRRSEELQEKIADLDYTLEYQQMEFDKIQADLKLQLEAEQQKLKDMQKEWNDKERAYQQQSSTAVADLQEELQRMQEARLSLLENQQQFTAERERLSATLQQQQVTLTNTETTLAKERDVAAEEKLQLQAEIQQERQRLLQAETFLEEAQQLFQSMEADLKQQLEAEVVKVQELSDRLDREQAEHDQQREILVARIQDEERKVQTIQDQLQDERLEAAKDKMRLEQLLAEEIRMRKVKKSQMKNRYEEIRKEMTALWQGALRDGRKQVLDLTNKYDGKMKTLQESVNQLQAAVDTAVLEKESLRVRLTDMTQQKERAVEAKKASEVRYQAAIVGKNEEIAVLRQDLLSQQEQCTETKQEIVQLRGSVRRLLKETVGLTTQRLFVKPVQFLGERTRRWKRTKE
jgi:hypothetical protein